MSFYDKKFAEMIFDAYFGLFGITLTYFTGKDNQKSFPQRGPKMAVFAQRTHFLPFTLHLTGNVSTRNDF